MAGIPYQSKLLPFASTIARWQRQGKTYRQIAVLLGTEHGLAVHPDTINSFVLVRVRAKKRPILPAGYLQPNPVRRATPALAGTSGRVPSSGPSHPPRVIASDGKEIPNAQYAPVNPDEL